MASDRFTKFMQEMSEAADKMDAFERDPEGTMKAAGLTYEEIALVQSGDEQKILDAFGVAEAMARRWVFRIRNIRIARFAV